ncbi:MAG TPA: hypothetical protein PLB38_03210 [bacterium]|nr:hypothetical protein [bacterium]
MAKFGQFFGGKDIPQNVAEYDFDSKIKGELTRAFENGGDYKKLEEALLREWQDHPHWRESDYLCNEPLNLEKLKMALALWKSLPTDPTERFLLLEEIKERGAKDAGDRVYLAVQCFEKYHLKNLSLLRKHWHNCLPGEENKEYDPHVFSRNINSLKDRYLLDEAINNLDDASLYVDLKNEADGRKRFAMFRESAFQEKFLNEKNREFVQKLFEPFWKK